MKIVFITPKFEPEIGGVEKHTYCVAKELAKYGNDILIITSTHQKNVKILEQQNRIKIYRLYLPLKYNNKINSLIDLLKMWFFLLTKYRELVRNDVIHLHDYQTFLWILPFIFLIRRPIFVTFHGFEKYPIPLFAKIIRKFTEITTKGSICIGNYISKWYGTRPVYVTIGGVTIPDRVILNNSTEKAGVFIGRLDKDTNILELIEALVILNNNYHVELPLHICGDGVLKSQIESYAKKNNQKIFEHGFVAYPQSYLLLCRYAFVTGYLSILEAMSYKRPVFAIYTNPLKKDYFYSIPNVEELMFIAASPKELAEKLSLAIKNPVKTELICEQAYQFAKFHTWSEVAIMYLKIYQKYGDLK